MMFEYNENLNKEERIQLVSNEIRKQYPLLDDENAIYMSAILSSPVDDKPTNDEKFERYYHLLHNIAPNNKEFLHIFNDLYNVYEDGIEKQQYNECTEEIIKFISGERFDFPHITEFYN